MSTLPDQKIKLAKRLQAILLQWRGLETQLTQVDATLTNLAEQKAALKNNSTEFRLVCRQGLGPEKASNVIPNIQDKIDSFEQKTKDIQRTLLYPTPHHPTRLNSCRSDLESLQKKMYQLRLEMDKSLPELATNPVNVVKTQNALFGWDDIIRWTIDLHTVLQIAIKAKKSDTPYDIPAHMDDIINRLECLNYIR